MRAAPCPRAAASHASAPRRASAGGALPRATRPSSIGASIAARPYGQSAVSGAAHSPRRTFFTGEIHRAKGEGKKPVAVVAVGGNALITDNLHQSLEDQYEAVSKTSEHVSAMIAAGWNVVLTHGNGPQVGFILRRSEIAKGQVPTVPVQYAVGDTQGDIGFMFQNALGNALHRRGMEKPVVTLVTQTLVDKNDKAFAKPDKPIGSFMSEAEAKALAGKMGWTVAKDSNRGWRRTIASPQPVRIIEAPIIERLTQEGVIVIACGGGGIPVQETELHGIDAVIDKDRASALLAIQLKADLLMIPTGVEKVAIRFGKPDQQWLHRVTFAEMKAFYDAGHFPDGSMGPKVEAMLRFLRERPGGKGLITNPESIPKALKGDTGTWIA